MSNRTPLMAGNWKMNLNHLEAIALVQKIAFSLDQVDFDAVEVAVLPPFTDLRSVQTLVDGDKLEIRYGAQDVSPHDAGAHTGDIAASMLAKLGCTYVTIGHSERREQHAESDDVVAAKTQATLAHGLVPIVCVGEGIEIRNAGSHVSHTLGQLRGSLAGLTAEQASAVVVAYEPVWAIGTGEVATPDDAEEMAGAIRSDLASAFGDTAAQNVRVLYGGSVKSSNVRSIMAGANVDGALVGGASLTGDEFAAIARYHREP